MPDRFERRAFSDFHTISVTCPTCSISVWFDAKAVPGDRRFHHSGTRTCPNCEKGLGHHADRIVDLFTRLHAAVAEEGAPAISVVAPLDVVEAKPAQ